MFDKPKAGEVATTTFSLVPTTFQDLLKLGEMMAGSDLVPNGYKGKAGNCVLAMQMGAELGLPPMQAVQSIAVINGKPGLYGDVGKALLRSRGCDIIENTIEERKKTGVASCRIKRKGQEDVVATFSIDDAKTAKLWGKQGPWTEYPYNQMGWRAFWFAARAAAADILKGLGGREEILDIDPERVIEATVTQPTRASEAAQPTAAAPAAPEPAAPPAPAPAAKPEKTQEGDDVAVVTVSKIDFVKLAPFKFEYTATDTEGVTYFFTDMEMAKVVKMAIDEQTPRKIVSRMAKHDLTKPAIRTLVEIANP